MSENEEKKKKKKCRKSKLVYEVRARLFISFVFFTIPLFLFLSSLYILSICSPLYPFFVLPHFLSPSIGYANENPHIQLMLAIVNVITTMFFLVLFFLYPLYHSLYLVSCTIRTNSTSLRSPDPCT